MNEVYLAAFFTICLAVFTARIITDWAYPFVISVQSETRPWILIERVLSFYSKPILHIFQPEIYLSTQITLL